MNEKLCEEENARDEFSASNFFKNQVKRKTSYLENKCHKNYFQDITNNKNLFNIRNNNQDFNLILNKQKDRIESQNFIDSRNVIITKKNLPRRIDCLFKSSKKRKKIRDFDENQDDFATQIIENYSMFKKRNKNDNSCVKDEVITNFSEINKNTNGLTLSHALMTPDNYNKLYKKYLVVTESSKFVKLEENSNLWNIMMKDSKINKKVSIISPRIWCSPREQYTINDKNQYRSQCLIKTYFLINDITYFYNDHIMDKASRFSKNKNTFVFHELFLEKLNCNKYLDFMPSNKNLTGIILGGFVNNCFDLCNYLFIPDEVIHYAVDLIYQYLSRVNEVTSEYLNWITLGALWVAATIEGISITNRIIDCTGCTIQDLRKNKMRLITVSDCNMTKPHAISFRNRFLEIEPYNSTTLYISGFILDMCLHCYTIMLLPASQRAAASLWLSRLIDIFDFLRHNEELSNGKEEAENKMKSVWPESFEQLTGYRHSDISLVALKMHVIVIAFISEGQSNFPSIKGCFEKYSSKKYASLSTSYERFTAVTVFRAIQFYCNMNDLKLSSWMAPNEYEILLNSVEHKIPLSRTTSCTNSTLDLLRIQKSISCPEITLKQNSKRNLNFFSNDSLLSPSVVFNESNIKIQNDSGYETSNSTNNI